MFLTLCLIQLPLFGEFYKNFTEAERKSVAEAYYLVGKQYESLGVKNAGTYLRLAYIIYPGLVPEEIQDDYEDELTDEAAILKGTLQNDAKLVQYRFRRMISFFLAQDTTAIGDYLDDEVYNGDFNITGTRESIQSELAALYEFMNTSGLTPETLFKLDSVQVSLAKSLLAEDTVLELTISPLSMDYSAYLPFWHEIQSYYWHQDVQGKWVLFAVSRQPLSEEYLTARKTTLVNKEITAAFKGCLGAFIREDLSTVSLYLGDTVEIVPMNSTLKKSEVEYTFTGYFEESPRLNIGNVDDLLNSIAISQSQEYTAKKSAPVYLVEIELNSEHTSKISFWAAYKKYYFIKTKARWKIIAIA
jgi:hypothetical protein